MEKLGRTVSVQIELAALLGIGGGEYKVITCFRPDRTGCLVRLENFIQRRKECFRPDRTGCLVRLNMRLLDPAKRFRPDRTGCLVRPATAVFSGLRFRFRPDRTGCLVRLCLFQTRHSKGFPGLKFGTSSL